MREFFDLFFRAGVFGIVTAILWFLMDALVYYLTGYPAWSDYGTIACGGAGSAALVIRWPKIVEAWKGDA